jgi:hypothetical protein
MWAIKYRQITPKRNQDGVAAVEFALVIIPFLIVVFGILETARALYILNTLPEVTRRAANSAANTSFKDDAALDVVRKRAVLDETNGQLPFGAPITYQNIRIEYLKLRYKWPELEIIAPTALPTCPAKNRLNCMKDPNSATETCIRAVQARICQEGQNGDTCTPVQYQTIFPLIPLAINLPTSLTTVATQTLGYKKGDLPCP